MSHESRRYSPHRNRSRHVDHYRNRRYQRHREQPWWLRDSLSSCWQNVNRQGSNNGSLPRFPNEELRNRFQHWTQQSVSSHLSHNGPPALARESSSSYYPWYQRRETLQENTSHTINHGNLVYARPQESYFSSGAQEHSQDIRGNEGQATMQQHSQQLENINWISMTRLPFFKVISSLLEVLIHPCAANHYNFVINEHCLHHFKDKTKNSYQIVVRFCKYDPEINQRDYFPSNLQVIVNEIMCPIPGCTTIPIGPAAPIEITSKCDFHKKHNTITVRSCEKLAMYVHIVRRLNHEDLLQELLAKNFIPPSVTRAKIQEKLQNDTVSGGDITMTSLHFALLCPLSKARMRLPCRALTCDHLQCFDAAFYLKMNEKKPKWVCPVCADPIEYENLQIDEHFKNILEENISNDKIFLQADGSWKPFLQQDLSENILTLDDTYECSIPVNNNVDDVTADVNCETQHTTIDLLSEDEASDEDDHANSDSAVPNCAPSTDNQYDKSVEVVVLSDDESLGSPSHMASKHRQQQQQHATSTPHSRFLQNSHQGMTPVLNNTEGETTKYGISICSIGDDFIPLDTSDVYI